MGASVSSTLKVSHFLLRLHLGQWWSYIHWEGITLRSLTGEVDNTDYLFMMPPVSGWDIGLLTPSPAEQCQEWTCENWTWATEELFLAWQITWGTPGTKMPDYGKMATQQRCDALGNVLLENLGSCQPCWCYFDTHHLPKYCCKPCTHFHGNGILWWLWRLSAG